VLLACSPQAPAQNAPAETVKADPRAQTGLREVQLTIRTKAAVHHFTVEVAASLQQQEQGLMFRRSLGADKGMIFPYDPPQDVSFWMKNTLIPLDILFIRTDGKIVRIATGQPMSLDPIGPPEPIAVVLEIRGCRAAELGIKEGDMVVWPR
jgi:uncharacterized membrane protein (UPF0127 family)